MNNTFAGFWRDGAIVKPEAEHFDCDDCLIARHKDNGSLDICISGYKDWYQVYWLDTTATEATTDKPDPGEGWRLLEVGEDLQTGDECYLKFGDPYDDWAKVNCSNNKQTPGMYYRRRIAPQYVPYTWDDRDELRGRWYRQKNDGHEQVAYYLANRDSDFRINSYLSEEFLDLCEWLDGTPCGKKVV